MFLSCTLNRQLLIFLTDFGSFGSPAKPTIAFAGDNLFKAPSTVELTIRNLSQFDVVTFDLLKISNFRGLIISIFV